LKHIFWPRTVVKFR